MLLLSSHSVELSQLPSGVLVPLGAGRFEIGYQRSSGLFWFRVVNLLVWPAAMLAFWWVGEIDTGLKLAALVGLCLVLVFLFTCDRRIIFDTSARAVRCGYVFLGSIPLGAERLSIEEEDCVVVQVTNHDGEHRHNPMYAVIIRRKGLLRGDIGLIELTMPESDPHPPLLAFAKLVGELLQIEHHPQIDTSKMQGDLSDLEYPL